MKFVGKYITITGLLYLVLMFIYGGSIIYEHGNNTYDLSLFQILSGVLFIGVTFIVCIIIVAYLLFMLICFCVWSFKNDSRTFSEFVKGIF